MARDPVRQIDRNSRAGGKTYAFDEEHDETRPAQMWFQESHEGTVLFVVFYTLACRWSQCLGCNLPAKMSRRAISFKSLMAQVDRVFREPEVEARRLEIRKVILSNNGSMLDERTFSSTALMYLMAQLNIHLTRLSVLTIETRAEYVDMAELEFLSRALDEGEMPTRLELAIGFEAFDDRIRNAVFRKGLKLSTFERLVRKLERYGFGLKCYFMLKPIPGLTEEEAIADIHNAIDYLSRIGPEHGLSINLHLNPTYVARGTVVEDAFRRGEYSAPSLVSVARAARHGRGKPLSIFVGLSDEGLAVEGGSFRKPGDAPLVALLEEFNRTQDYAILDSLASRKAG